MKKELFTLTILVLSLILLPVLSAEDCSVTISKVNQDPLYAIPGDYVKLVFQINGVENPNCGIVKFKVNEKFPFSLDPNSTNELTINSGTYARTYSSYYIAPYNIRVDKDAIDGENPLEVVYSYGGAELLKTFNISVEDTNADFEIYVKNYDYATSELTFEILNTEDVDVKALTLEIPKQDNIQIKGANKKVVGDLDSNEYTTSTFESIPKDGDMQVKIIYTDSINERRELIKNVTFDSSYFKDSNGNKKSSSLWIYIVIAIVVAWFVWRRIKKYQMKKKLLHQRH